MARLSRAVRCTCGALPPPQAFTQAAPLPATLLALPPGCPAHGPASARPTPARTERARRRGSREFLQVAGVGAGYCTRVGLGEVTETSWNRSHRAGRVVWGRTRAKMSSVRRLDANSCLNARRRCWKATSAAPQRKMCAALNLNGVGGSQDTRSEGRAMVGVLLHSQVEAAGRVKRAVSSSSKHGGVSPGALDISRVQ